MPPCSARHCAQNISGSFRRKDITLKTRYSIFLSHTSHDGQWCAPFVTELRAKGLDVFYDEHDLLAAQQWIPELEKQIKRRDILVLILTPDSWKSPWVQIEFQFAMHLGKPILPLVLKPLEDKSFIDLRQHLNVAHITPAEGAKRLIRELDRLNLADLAFNSPLPTNPRAQSGEDAPHLLSQTTREKNLQGRIISDVEVILPPWRFIPAGPFWMGSDRVRDKDATDSELAEFSINVAPFAIALYPVTVQEYTLAVKGNIVKAPQNNHISWEEQIQHPSHPVVNVSWYDAIAYTQWLSALTEQIWRLPTEIEWEKAAKADQKYIYPWGNKWKAGLANTKEENVKTTSTIGAYPQGASPYLIYDLIGNVGEWCHSKMEPYPYQTPAIPVLEASDKRIIRGGSWNSTHLEARITARRDHFPEIIAPTFGFRLVLDIANAL